MNYRNCCLVKDTFFIILFLLLQPTVSGRRVKRLSTPEFDHDYTLSLAKYVVSIRSRSPELYFGDNHFCGGAIIAPRFVLTCGHCVMDKSKFVHASRTLLVVGGTPNRFKFVDNVSVNKPVVNIHIPINFTSHNTNNIAVLTLKSDWPTNNPRIGIAQLPLGEPNYNASFSVLGWGRIYKGGPLSSKILHINITLVDHETCGNALISLQDEMLCGKNVIDDLERSPCDGDDGAPLFENNTVYGITSYALGCGDITLPSIYTDVWHEIDFIKKIINTAHRLVPQIALFSLSVWVFFI